MKFWAINGATQSFALGSVINPRILSQPAKFGDWYRKSVLVNQDGTQQIFYSNFYGMVILSVLVSADGLRKWCSFNLYDGAGRIVWQVSPSAISDYDDNLDDLLGYNSGTGKFQYLKDHEGLIRITEYGGNPDTANYVRKDRDIVQLFLPHGLLPAQ